MDATQDAVTETPRLGGYTIDTTASTIHFRTKHMFGLLPVRGTFAIGKGTVDVAEPVEESRVRVEVDVNSFDSGNPQRDGNVKSDKFLDPAAYPVMTFVSDRVEGTRIHGRLTVRDVEQPVTLQVVATDVGADRFSARATTRVDRMQFGVTATPGMTGRYLDLTLEVTCVRS